MKKIITLIIAGAALSFLSSCAKIGGGGSGLSGYQSYDRPATLPSNPSAVRVKVSISKQMIYVLENGKPLLVAPCTTGAHGSTPLGNFSIFNKTQYKRANSHGWAYSGKNAMKTTTGSIPSGYKFTGTPMPYWCEFKSNYGFHTGWVKHYPSSHGCIRIHENIAPKFFRLVKVGTPVSIASSQAEDSSIGANVPLAPDAGPLPDYDPSMYIGQGYYSRHKSPSFQ